MFRLQFERIAWGISALALAAVLLAGCRGRVQSTSAPAPETRVGVVDLQVVTRAHPRWSELDALLKQLQDVQVQLAQLPPAPALPEADVQRVLDEEARRLQVELQKELAFLKQDGERRLEIFADDLRREQEGKLAEIGQELQAQGEHDLAAKRGELRAQLGASEQQIRVEYLYPLLNLRLRIEVAGLTSEDEAKQLLQQLQALQQERETRIQARADETQQAFVEFQKAKEAEMNGKLKAAREALQAEGQRRLAIRQQEIQAELGQAVAELDHTFHARLEQRRKTLLEAAQGRPASRQGTYVESLGERSRRLRAELISLQEQQRRLEDSILAEVKIEVATTAQERKLDVVLTRYVTNVAGIDITTDVIQKLKR